MKKLIDENGRLFGLVSGDYAHHLALVGDLQHVVAEHVACAEHLRFHGNGVFVHLDIDA